MEMRKVGFALYLSDDSKGHHTHDKKKYGLSQATKYVGYQAAHVIVAFFGLMVLGLIITIIVVTCIYWEAFRKRIVSFLLSTVLIWAITWLVQRLYPSFQYNDYIS